MSEAASVGPTLGSSLAVGPLAVEAHLVGPLIAASLTIEPPLPVVVVYLTTQAGSTLTTQAGEPLEVAA